MTGKREKVLLAKGGAISATWGSDGGLKWKKENCNVREGKGKEGSLRYAKGRTVISHSREGRICDPLLEKKGQSGDVPRKVVPRRGARVLFETSKGRGL